MRIRAGTMWKRLFLLGLVLLAICLTFYYLSPDRAELVEKRQGAAVILQAIWSVVAVIVAIILPQIQLDVREQEDIRRKLALLKHMAKSAFVILDEAADAAASDHGARAYLDGYDPMRWQAAREVLAAFQIVALRTVSQAQALVEIRSEFSKAAEQLAQSHTAMTPFDRSALTTWRAGLRKIVPMRDRAQTALRHLQHDADKP